MMEVFFGFFTDDYERQLAVRVWEAARGVRTGAINEEEQERRRRREAALAANAASAGSGGGTAGATSGARRGKGLRPPKAMATVQPRTMSQRFAGVASGSQAAVVKLTSYGSGARMGAMVNYLSRGGEISIEDEQGRQLVGREEQASLRGEWNELFQNRTESKDIAVFGIDIEAGVSEARPDELVESVIASAFGDRRHVYGAIGRGAGRYTVHGLVVLRSSTGERLTADERARAIVQQRFDQSAAAIEAKATFSFGGHGNGTEFGVAAIRTLAERFPGHLRDEKGAVIADSAAGAQLIQKDWRRDLHSRKSRDVMHVIISGKAGTDVAAFRLAVRDFLATQFDGYKYAYALHDPVNDPKDSEHGGKRPHVHAHAVIVMRNHAGERIETTPEVFRQWRATMAEKARGYGIAMEMTDRRENAAPPAYTRTQVRPVSHRGRTEHEGTSQAAHARYSAKRDNKAALATSRASRTYAVKAKETWAALARASGDTAVIRYAQSVEVRLAGALGAERAGQSQVAPLSSRSQPDRSDSRTTMVELEKLLTKGEAMTYSRSTFAEYENEIHGALKNVPREAVDEETRNTFTEKVDQLLDAQRVRMELAERLERLQREQGLTSGGHGHYESAMREHGAADVTQAYEVVKSLEEARYAIGRASETERAGHADLVDSATDRLLQLANEGNRYADHVVKTDKELAERQAAWLRGQDAIGRYEFAASQASEHVAEPRQQPDGSYSYSMTEGEVEGFRRERQEGEQRLTDASAELLNLAVVERNSTAMKYVRDDAWLSEQLAVRVGNVGSEQVVSTEHAVAAAHSRHYSVGEVKSGDALLEAVATRLEAIKEAENENRSTSFSRLAYHTAVKDVAEAALDGNSYLQDVARRTHELHIAVERARHEREADHQNSDNRQVDVRAGDTSRSDPAAQQVRRTEELEIREQLVHNKDRDRDDMER